MPKYPEYNSLDLTAIASEILEEWRENRTFEKSVESRPADKPFVFYEGPPSANGMPGIHHVMARTIKDIFCRYRTAKGYRVERKAGWDTHGLPIELGVEKELGIKKEDIGVKISVEEYNDACRKAVMRYTDVWNDLTEKMGYWVDMGDPYVTYHSKYMETLWWLLRQLYDRGLLYKGYTIQPYSPAAGSGLSSHELNQPGTYKPVKDTSATALFETTPESNERLAAVTGREDLPHMFMVWTTTPWTLPSNTALAVNPKFDYVVVETFNRYTGDRLAAILVRDRLKALLHGPYVESAADGDFEAYRPGDKKIPFRIIGEMKGKDLPGLRYRQLLEYATPMETPEEAFRVIAADYVTTEDGTGVVHIAPTFGADDARVAKEAGVPPMRVADAEGKPVPLVDLSGKFIAELPAVGGMYVKNEYYPEGEAPEKSADVLISIQLKEEGKAFLIEKYEHSYPHCWRTDKPVLYYPLDSWFIRTTQVKDRLLALNKTINWKPESTGTGRFGNWLENLNDWNLSRSRFWGTPIPIWRTENGDAEICVGSVAELKTLVEKSVEAGLMDHNPLADFDPDDMSEENYNRVDLHKHYMDDIVLVSEGGAPMYREPDLMDVWFDSGAMPYAQWHYPFENREKIDGGLAFPADFIAEGVDQTRGWFFTLHALATMGFDSVAFKNVISNGLVLDKKGRKMSKRLGNAADPFKTLKAFGPDATRWYMITNAQPWDNLRFDPEGIEGVKRKFFGTLYNTYAFFALYANVDGFVYKEADVPHGERPEIDRWIISRLNAVLAEVDAAYADYEPTKAGRIIQNFVTDELSNWYVRLGRRRFWKGEYGADKVSAFQSLYTCLESLAIAMAPIAPFFADRLYRDLNGATGKRKEASVHLAYYPEPDPTRGDAELDEKMDIARRITGLVLGLRKQEKIKVRQPLQKLVVPVADAEFERRLRDVSEVILAEVNVKTLECLTDASGLLVKEVKPDFKKLGPRMGKDMKRMAAAIAGMDSRDIEALEKTGERAVDLGDGRTEVVGLDEVSITTKDIPGWLVASEGGLTVALDVSLTEALVDEGIAREMVNRVQNLRKESGLEVTDRIALEVQKRNGLDRALNNNLEYICAETLADSMELVDGGNSENWKSVEVAEGMETKIRIRKI